MSQAHVAREHLNVTFRNFHIRLHDVLRHLGTFLFGMYTVDREYMIRLVL